MPSVVLPSPPSVKNKPTNSRSSTATSSNNKKRFTTVLGHSFTSVFRDSSSVSGEENDIAIGAGSTTTSPATTSPTSFHIRGRSIDLAGSYQQRRKQRLDRASVATVSFYEPMGANTTPTPLTTTIATPPSDKEQRRANKMIKLETAAASTAHRRSVVRIDNQDGPWSVSVAESPYASYSYSLYIKTPTHNLTLTRTAMEIVELHEKLTESHPNHALPSLPIDPSTLPVAPKRKSTFLNTLSRLASPSAKANRLPPSVSARKNEYKNVELGMAGSSVPYILPTPVSVSTTLMDVGDPFTEVGFTDPVHLNGGGSGKSSATPLGSSDAAETPTDTPTAGALSISTSTATNEKADNSTVTGLAAYLTTISNTPGLRQTRVWKRFFRVRTDDLESVRAEKAIKRVRSDLGTQVKSNGNRLMVPGGLGLRTAGSADVSEVSSVDGELRSEEKKEEQAEKQVEENEKVDEEVVEAPLMNGTEKDDVVDRLIDTQDEHSSQAPGEINEKVVVAEEPETYLEPESPLPESAEPVLELPNVEVAVEVGQDTVQVPTTPTTPNRIHRSQSADPDKASRLTRAYKSSASDLTNGSSANGTGDDEESSVRTPARRTRKKRSLSVDPSLIKDKEKKKSMRKVVIDDFEMMRVLGKGCAGKVLLVRQRATAELYALKAITKRHVLAHQELQHTLTEQAVLKKMSAESKDPFVVKLWWSFHDKENLFLVMDFHPGGDLATQLARWGRLGRDRARFYAAEIVEGVEGLHAAGVIYRDLKPENILIGADGHIVLTDFGLSKEFSRPHPARVLSSSSTSGNTPALARNGSEGDFYSSSVTVGSQPATPPWMKSEKGELASGWPGQGLGQSDQTSTFCGTAEYLAPEVIQGLAYSYEVDWWSFGTMLYEMLTGITPFWANNHSDMYVRVLQDELQFPDDRAIDQDTKSLIRGLLQRNPVLRMCEPRIKRHPYFSMIDWSHVYYKRYIPPYIPPIDPSNASDTQNFDDTFLDMEPVLDEYNGDQTDTDAEREQTDTEPTDGEDSATTPSQSRSSSIPSHPLVRPGVNDDSVDVFDGYSFKGRDSVLIDDEEEEAGEESLSEDESEELDMDGLGALAPREEEEEVMAIGDAESRVEELEPKTPEARNSDLSKEEPVVEEIPKELEPEVESEPDIPEAPAVVPEKPAPVPDEANLETIAAMALAAAAVDKERQYEREVKEQREVKEKELREKEGKEKDKSGPSVKPSAGRVGRSVRSRREKSGVAALDRYLSDTIDEDATEREEEDEDWDFIERVDGEDRNGTKGTSLFARGVVDRYRLAVFRKASTPTQRSNQIPFSALPKESEASIPGDVESPSPSDKQRRGRSSGLGTFRKKQFLRPKSPTRKKSDRGEGALSSTRSLATAGRSASGVGTLTGMSHSLRSKQSATSMGDQSMSSEPEPVSVNTSIITTNATSTSGSLNTSTTATPTKEKEAESSGMFDTVKGSPVDEKQKNKKLRKYKENAEKVFSIFASPRPPS